MGPVYSCICIYTCIYTIYVYLYITIQICRRRRWHPTPVLLPGKSHGRKNLVGCRPGGRKESDTTERLPFTSHFHALEKEMATHSSVLAWRIPGTGEPGGLPSVGSHSQTRLKRLSSSSMHVCIVDCLASVSVLVFVYEHMWMSVCRRFTL